MKTASGRRHFTYLRGRNSEFIALLWLMAKGYRPLARRYTAPGGEIDLIMRRGGTIAFVEVKARDAMDVAAASIGATKQRRFSRAAGFWVARHPWAAELTLRADAVFLAPGHLPRHVANAFALGF